jgi:hypothetical protein
MASLIDRSIESGYLAPEQQIIVNGLQSGPGNFPVQILEIKERKVAVAQILKVHLAPLQTCRPVVCLSIRDRPLTSAATRQPGIGGELLESARSSARASWERRYSRIM